jgi:hypothetical protein
MQQVHISQLSPGTEVLTHTGQTNMQVTAKTCMMMMMMMRKVQTIEKMQNIN